MSTKYPSAATSTASIAAFGEGAAGGVAGAADMSPRVAQSSGLTQSCAPGSTPLQPGLQRGRALF
jgi:hypothetical protein